MIGAASYLQVDQLLLLCSQQLIAHISRYWNLVLSIANCYGLANVRRAVCKHISKNLHQIWHDDREMWDKFRDLPARDLCTVLDDDDCNVTEKEIFDAAIAWLLYECTRITSHSTEVLAVVRFPLMSPADLEMCTLKLVSVDMPADCYSALLDEAKAYQHHADAVVSSRRTRMRNSVDVVIALGGFTASEHTTNRFQVLPVAELLEHSSKEIRWEFSFFSKCHFFFSMYIHYT